MTLTVPLTRTYLWFISPTVIFFSLNSSYVTFLSSHWHHALTLNHLYSAQSVCLGTWYSSPATRSHRSYAFKWKYFSRKSSLPNLTPPYTLHIHLFFPLCCLFPIVPPVLVFVSVIPKDPLVGGGLSLEQLRACHKKMNPTKKVDEESAWRRLKYICWNGTETRNGREGKTQNATQSKNRARE